MWSPRPRTIRRQEAPILPLSDAVSLADRHRRRQPIVVGAGAGPGKEVTAAGAQHRELRTRRQLGEPELCLRSRFVSKGDSAYEKSKQQIREAPVGRAHEFQSAYWCLIKHRA